MELILMRHGTTQGNLERRFIGTLDVPLLPQGEELARRQIAVRAGLHCAPLAHRTAGTLESGTIRISPSVFNTEGQINFFLREMREILRENTKKSV